MPPADRSAAPGRRRPSAPSRRSSATTCAPRRPDLAPADRPELEARRPHDPDGAPGAPSGRPAGARHPIQPTSTRVIDLRPDEDALFGALRKKWRQYVNKARTAASWSSTPRATGSAEFYRIYRETADRAGFLIRTEPAYRDVWEAFRPSGRARLLFAQSAEGEPLATLFLVRSGPRVVEPYGGMTRPAATPGRTTCSSGRPSVPRASRGATSYDLWGLATGGIAHFKTGFGGREVRYIGAWDLTLDPLGRQVYERGGPRAGCGGRAAATGCGRRRASAYPGADEAMTPAEPRGHRGRARGTGTIDRHAPGGHVYQSTAWAEQRARLGWRPRFVRIDDEHPALVLLRRFPWIGGASAYVPRGPVADPATSPRRGAAAAARRPGGLARRGGRRRRDRCRGPGRRARVRPAAATAGFHPIPEIQPSRHRMSLALARDTDDEAVRSGVTKAPASASTGPSATASPSNATTRRAGRGAARCSGPGRPLGRCSRTSRPCSRRPASASASGSGRATCSSTGGGPPTRRALLVYLEARDGAAERVLGGLDPVPPRRAPLDGPLGRCARRPRDPPGGHAPAPLAGDPAGHPRGPHEMDLGGVDIGPDHPSRGEGDRWPDCTSTSARSGRGWVAMTGAHERVVRPWRYALGSRHGAARPPSADDVPGASLT